MGRYALAAKFSVSIMLVIAIVAGATALYLYLLPQDTASQNTALGVNAVSSMSSTLSSATSSSSSSGATKVDTTKFLGYIPQGYQLAPHQENAPVFPCPPDMSASDCKLFQQTCGNGVCDPNERCDTCPIDCAPTGNLVCDPYTGRAGSPASVCQAIVNGNNYG